MTVTVNLDPEKKPSRDAVKPPKKSKPQKHRNWTWFDDEQQQRFIKAQKKKGLDGSSLLSMIFNEFADREGL